MNNYAVLFNILNEENIPLEKEVWLASSVYVINHTLLQINLIIFHIKKVEFSPFIFKKTFEL